MEIRERFLLCFRITIMAALLIACTFQSVAQAQKVIEWKMLSSWTSEFTPFRTFFVPFAEKVNQRAQGRMKITWSGPEVVPVFEQLKPVREGVFDGVFTVPAYHSAEVSIGNGMTLVKASGKERREAGLVRIVDEVYRKKANVTYLSAMADGAGFQLVLKKKIEKADLSGLKIRTSPLYDPMIKTLHGAPVRIAGGEAYTALEKGLVDGIMWTCVGFMDYKYHEVTKYIVRPSFGDVVYTVLVNLNSWNRLPMDLQDLLFKTAVEMEEEGRAAMRKHYEQEEKELRSRGMEILTLSPEEAEKFLDAFYQSSWEELVLKRDRDFGLQLREACDRLRKK